MYLCDGFVTQNISAIASIQLRLKAIINEHVAFKCGSFWTHFVVNEDFPFNLFMLDASKLKCIYLCDGLVIKIFLQLPQLH